MTARAFFWLLAICLTGCGSSAAEVAGRHIHAGLNALTDAADPAYELAVAACDARAQQIVDRESTSLEADRAALADLRRTCDAIFGRFEELRQAQQQARALADQLAVGAAEVEEEAAAALRRIRQLWAGLRELIPAGWRPSAQERRR